MVLQNAKDKIIVPIDTNDIDNAIKIVTLLKPHVGMFKFGLELLTYIIAQIAFCPDNTPSQRVKTFRFIKKVQQLFSLVEGQLFYDGKWDDISNTVGGAAKAIGLIKPIMVNVHASSGLESIIQTVKNSPDSLVLGVTVLTSIDSDECVSIFGKSSSEKVVEFARMIETAEAHGIICSPKELSLLTNFPKLIKVTPGVRPLWAAVGDQKRIMTPREALDAGADYLVIGRPITKPPVEIGSPIDAVKKIVEEMEA